MISEPIRVIQVFAQMNRGGAETTIMNLYRNIDRSKVQFDFIVHTDKKCAFDDEIRSLGGRIFNVPAYNGKNHFSYKKCWVNFFKEHSEIKIIHSHVRSTAAIYLSLGNKEGKITIAHSHNTSSGKGLTAVAKNILQYKIRYIADYKFACSKIAGEWLYGKNVYKKDNFYILNNSIETSIYIYDSKIRKKKREELKVEGKNVIGHIGRFHKQKNHEFLIDIFKEIHELNDNALLILVGDGNLRASIEDKVIKLGLEDYVIFTGIRSDIPELLQVFDVFLFPSLYEGLPVTVIEAQAAGLKCFLSDTITNEVVKTDLVEFISLKSSCKYWSNKVSKYLNGYERINTTNKIIEEGFDVRENANWLETFYLECRKG